MSANGTTVPRYALPKDTMMGHHYFCRSCYLYFACKRPNPEKVLGKCPKCSGYLILGHGHTLEEAKRDLGLSTKDVSDLEVIVFERVK